MKENIKEFKELEDIEEVVTPSSAGSLTCCTGLTDSTEDMITVL